MGGFKAKEYCALDQSLKQNRTILEGKDVSECYAFYSVMPSDITFDGFTIQNFGGSSNNRLVLDETKGQERLGGGILFRNVKVKFKNMIFESNMATSGGAVSLFDSKAEFVNCAFHDSKALANGKGGAVEILNSDATFEACKFTKNSAIGGKLASGGALAIYNEGDYESNAIISNCSFGQKDPLSHLENYANKNGGAIFISSTYSAKR